MKVLSQVRILTACKPGQNKKILEQKVSLHKGKFPMVSFRTRGIMRSRFVSALKLLEYESVKITIQVAMNAKRNKE